MRFLESEENRETMWVIYLISHSKNHIGKILLSEYQIYVITRKFITSILGIKSDLSKHHIRM